MPVPMTSQNSEYRKKAYDICVKTGYGECDPKCIEGVAQGVREAVIDVLSDMDTAICNAFLGSTSQLRRQGASSARRIIKDKIAALRKGA